MLVQANWPRATAAFLNERLSRLEHACREAGVPFYDDAGVDDHLQRVLLASDFAYESFLRDPRLLGPELLQLMSDPRHADARAGALADAGDLVALRRALRVFRLREALRLIWRDVTGADDVETTLAGASVLAETCPRRRCAAPSVRSPSATARSATRAAGRSAWSCSASASSAAAS